MAQDTTATTRDTTATARDTTATTRDTTATTRDTTATTRDTSDRKWERPKVCVFGFWFVSEPVLLRA